MDIWKTRATKANKGAVEANKIREVRGRQDPTYLVLAGSGITLGIYCECARSISGVVSRGPICSIGYILILVCEDKL